ncbi:MAG TPA: DUF3224 domain-containing protein, partial [Thermomicrobiales bacterium]|nr:DUF3224 domain-containing protein [Thermomicrobiales bacterium]
MLERASGQFTIEGNVEDIFGGISGATRIARISQTCLFTGALQGESIAEYTAVLPRNADGSFQGYQRISGTLGDREGAFVVCVTGDYAKGQPRGSWTIVPKSGSGDFVHIRGSGTFSQSPGKAGSYKLEFDLRKPRKARDAASVTEGDLVPGIDIAADEPVASQVQADATATLEEPAVSKPARRSRKKQEPAEPVVAEVEPIAVEPKPAPRRSRKKTAPVVAQPVAETPVPAPAPTRKRSRKKETPIVEEAAAIAVEPAPKRRRTRSKATVEQIAAEPAPVAETPRKRARKPTKIEAAEPIVPEPAPAAEPKPARRKKTVTPPPEPVPLPIAQDKPTRQR